MAATRIPNYESPVGYLKDASGQDQPVRISQPLWRYLAHLSSLIGPAGPPGPPGPSQQWYQRTLLIKDTTIGNNIADNVPVQQSGTAQIVIGMLRLAITSDLTIRINVNGTALITATIPLATAVATAINFTAFSSNRILTQGDALTCDITASDGSTDADGVASFTLEWQ